MPKVLISDKLSPAAVDIFRRRGIDVDLKTGLSPAELRAIIPAYDGLAIRSATKVTKELLDVATNLKVIGRAGIGVDNVDIRSATGRGVIGCGNIGSIVANRAVGLHMKVIAYDPYLSDTRALDLGVEKVELDALLQRSDIITLHVPMTDATRNILSRETLARTQP